jgi:hypothetical protein
MVSITWTLKFPPLLLLSVPWLQWLIFVGHNSLLIILLQEWLSVSASRVSQRAPQNHSSEGYFAICENLLHSCAMWSELEYDHGPKKNVGFAYRLKNEFQFPYEGGLFWGEGLCHILVSELSWLVNIEFKTDLVSIATHLQTNGFLQTNGLEIKTMGKTI